MILGESVDKILVIYFNIHLYNRYPIEPSTFYYWNTLWVHFSFFENVLGSTCIYNYLYIYFYVYTLQGTNSNISLLEKRASIFEHTLVLDM